MRYSLLTLVGTVLALAGTSAVNAVPDRATLYTGVYLPVEYYGWPSVFCCHYDYSSFGDVTTALIRGPDGVVPLREYLRDDAWSWLDLTLDVLIALTITLGVAITIEAFVRRLWPIIPNAAKSEEDSRSGDSIRNGEDDPKP